MGVMTILSGAKVLVNKWTIGLLAIFIIVLVGYKAVDNFTSYMETTVSEAVRASEEKLIAEINQDRYAKEFEALKGQIALNQSIIERQNIAIADFMSIREDIDDGLKGINKELRNRTNDRVNDIGEDGLPSVLSPYLTDLFSVIGDAETELNNGAKNEVE